MKTKAVILDVSERSMSVISYRVIVEDEESFKLIANYLSSAISYSNSYNNSRTGYHNCDIIADHRISSEHIEIIKALVDDYRIFTLYDDTEVPDGYTGWVRSQNINWED